MSRWPRIRSRKIQKLAVTPSLRGATLSQDIRRQCPPPSSEPLIGLSKWRPLPIHFPEDHFRSRFLHDFSKELKPFIPPSLIRTSKLHQHGQSSLAPLLSIKLPTTTTSSFDSHLPEPLHPDLFVSRVHSLIRKLPSHDPEETYTTATSEFRHIYQVFREDPKQAKLLLDKLTLSKKIPNLNTLFQEDIFKDAQAYMRMMMRKRQSPSSPSNYISK
jgi:hypothetical protein